MKEAQGNELLWSIIGGIYFNPAAKHRTGLSVCSDCSNIYGYSTRQEMLGLGGKKIHFS